MNKAFEKIINRFKQLQGCDSLANMFISDVIKVIKSIEKNTTMVGFHAVKGYQKNINYMISHLRIVQESIVILQFTIRI